MFRRPTSRKSGLATILLVLLLALPGTAIASGGGGEGGGGDGGSELESASQELRDAKSQRETLERELETLSKIDLNAEMNEFIDKKKTKGRIKQLVSSIQTLSSEEENLKRIIDQITQENLVKLIRYIQYFTIQSYLGLPPFTLEVLLLQDPLAQNAFQIVTMMAAFDPVFRFYFETRYGYMFAK